MLNSISSTNQHIPIDDFQFRRMIQEYQRRFYCADSLAAYADLRILDESMYFEKPKKKLKLKSLSGSKYGDFKLCDIHLLEFEYPSYVPKSFRILNDIDEYVTPVLITSHEQLAYKYKQEIENAKRETIAERNKHKQSNSHKPTRKLSVDEMCESIDKMLGEMIFDVHNFLSTRSPEVVDYRRYLNKTAHLCMETVHHPEANHAKKFDTTRIQFEYKEDPSFSAVSSVFADWVKLLNERPDTEEDFPVFLNRVLPEGVESKNAWPNTESFRVTFEYDNIIITPKDV